MGYRTAGDGSFTLSTGQPNRMAETSADWAEVSSGALGIGQNGIDESCSFNNGSDAEVYLGAMDLPAIRLGLGGITILAREGVTNGISYCGTLSFFGRRLKSEKK